MKEYKAHNTFSHGISEIETGGKMTFSESTREFLFSSSTSKNFYLYDLDGNLKRQFEGKTIGTFSASFSCDDSLLALSRGSKIFLIEKSSGETIWSINRIKPFGNFFNRPSETILHLRFISQHEVVAIGINFIAIISVKDGEILNHIPSGPTDMTTSSITFNDDKSKLFLTYSLSTKVNKGKVFDSPHDEYAYYLATFELPYLRKDEIGFSKRTSSVLYNAPIVCIGKNKLISGIKDELDLIELPNKVLSRLDIGAKDLDLSRDKNLLAVRGDCKNYLIDVEKMKILSEFDDGTKYGSLDLKFSKDSKSIYSSTVNKEIKVWNLDDML